MPKLPDLPLRRTKSLTHFWEQYLIASLFSWWFLRDRSIKWSTHYQIGEYDKWSTVFDDPSSKSLGGGWSDRRTRHHVNNELLGERLNGGTSRETRGQRRLTMKCLFRDQIQSGPWRPLCWHHTVEHLWGIYVCRCHRVMRHHSNSSKNGYTATQGYFLKDICDGAHTAVTAPSFKNTLLMQRGKIIEM